MRVPILTFILLVTADSSHAQAPGGAAPLSPASRLLAQRAAMQALASLDGTWRGAADIEGGKTHAIQTERVGSLLEGTVKVIEGRSYGASGQTLFNALGIISYDPMKRAYSMHSYAMGYSGDFPVEVTANGFAWTQPVGPGASVRYAATISNGEWRETGDRLAKAAPMVRIFEMRLKRVGDTDWPAANGVPGH